MRARSRAAPVRRGPPVGDPHARGRTRPRSSRSTASRRTGRSCSRRSRRSRRRRGCSRRATRSGSQEVDDPPPDSGILGPVDSPDSLTVTIALGGSLFDGRYGLAAARPRQLTAMPAFANDQLDPARTGGDVLLQICAGQRDTVVHTFRELMRAIDGRFVVRWTIDGFQSAPAWAVRQEQPAQPVRVPRRDLQPGRHRPGRDEPADLGPARQRRAGVGRRRHVLHRPHDPHARRVLGSRRHARAGADDRPRPGHGRAARRDQRVPGPATTARIPWASASR